MNIRRSSRVFSILSLTLASVALPAMGAVQKLILAGLDKAMARAFAARKPPDDRSLIPLCDGIRLHGRGSQLVAEEILKQPGVPDLEIAGLRSKWSVFLSAVERPLFSLGEFLKLQALATKNGGTPDERTTAIFTNGAN